MRSDENAVAFCPHCGNSAPQELIGMCHHLHAEDGSHHFLLAKCQTCYEGLLYREIDPDNGSFGNRRFAPQAYELVWPKNAALHTCVPDAIAKIYAEASAIKSRAPNAFANQIRRSLEAVCKDRQAAGNTLAGKLKYLADKGEIPQTLAEITDVLRQLGNVGSHAGDEDIAPEYVEVIDDFFRAVIEYVYIAPHKVAEFKARLQFAQQTGKQPRK